MELAEQVSVIIKLLYMNTMRNVIELESILLMTSKQKIAYSALDGKRKINEIARVAGIGVRTLETLLPEWERKGLIMTMGKGSGKNKG